VIKDFSTNPKIRIISPEGDLQVEYDSAEELLIGDRGSSYQTQASTSENKEGSAAGAESVSKRSTQPSEPSQSGNGIDEEQNDDVTKASGTPNIEYLRFDNPIYHLKRPELNRTFCGLEIGDRNHTTGNQEPQLLDPCKPCHGETAVKTVEEQKQELRKEISERVIDIPSAQVEPGEFSSKELIALCDALPTELAVERKSPETVRSALSRAIIDVERRDSNPQQFSRDELGAITNALSDQGIVPNEPAILILYNDGYVSRVSASEFRKQKRGGKGKIIGDTDRQIADLVSVIPRDDLLIFTNHGNVYEMEAYRVPERDTEKQGKRFHDLLPLSEGESVQSLFSVSHLDEYDFVVTLTENGYIKRTPVNKFENILSTGIVAIEIKEGDTLQEVAVASDNQDIFIGTKNGRTIRFHDDEARSMGRTARGVQGIDLKSDDKAVSMAITGRDDSVNGQILTVTQNGYGKRTNASDYKSQSRNGLGLIDIITDQRNGPVVNISHVDGGESLLIATQRSKAIHTETEGISVVNRNTKGVILINISGDDKVVACTRVPRMKSE
jgi:DNA gyrase subunit A